MITLLWRIITGLQQPNLTKKTECSKPANKPTDILPPFNPRPKKRLPTICGRSKAARASIISRREVLSGKAKFGIVGDGKELPQIALAKYFQNGDFRSGYYRDQTLALVLGMVTFNQLFAQLYAHPDLDFEPHSAGRQMNAHFATRLLDENGQWKSHTAQPNTSADISPTAGQMPRALGLALASKKYRELPDLHDRTQFSNQGNEITFVTIGDASTSEGHFWETLNAAGVLKVPMIVSVWDDGYGISVPIDYQTTKGSISAATAGFAFDEQTGKGIYIRTVRAWDYVGLCNTYREVTKLVREHHIPALIHVQEVTQPQGHSTSGDHRRYKQKERLDLETEKDCNRQMRLWLIENGYATDEQLTELEAAAKQEVREAQKRAWQEVNAPIQQYVADLNEQYQRLQQTVSQPNVLSEAQQQLQKAIAMGSGRREIAHSVRTVLMQLHNELASVLAPLKTWKDNFQLQQRQTYNSYLFSQSNLSALNVQEVPAIYNDDSPMIEGFAVLNACFDAALLRMPELMAFGEDVGKIGDVNQSLQALQDKYGEARVFDTGIRELTIMGQGIGLAMRGLRPIAEIQYLDYFLYGLQPVSDDLATLQYRTCGGQKAPLIIRTRGHRLEGIWHAGSPIGMLLGSVRGVHLLVPRNMTQAAGFYNTLLQSDDPAIVIEVLNGYRLREKLPANISEMTVPLGQTEVLRRGTEVYFVLLTVRVAALRSKPPSG